MSQERTERATPRRRQEARKKGQIARSTELSSAVGLLASVVFLRWYGGFASGAISTLMRGTFEGLDGLELTPLALQHLGWQAAMTFARVTGPLLGLVLVVGVASATAQGGFVFSLHALRPDFNRINPAVGAKRIVSKRGAFETVKAILKLGVVAALTYPLVRADIGRFASLTGGDPLGIGRALGGALADIGLRASVAYLALALVDYGYQRWEYERRLRMSRQEIREEMKHVEGNPELKARIRRLQRQLAKRRMMADVPKATVVVTNPTHYAVAIRFDLETMAAPVVVAKGSGAVAQRIKEVAREHRVPVVENKPLAQALFKATEIGMEIPVALYEAVADVIAYVYRARTGRA
ncbi:MAG: flagellar biosynthesis protein FlhB [Thermomicrobiaceae bacterium]|nr:flagellar biosynthesis protein FlhB [Thermomicrobiaceae bacterium]